MRRLFQLIIPRGVNAIQALAFGVFFGIFIICVEYLLRFYIRLDFFYIAAIISVIGAAAFTLLFYLILNIQDEVDEIHSDPKT